MQPIDIAKLSADTAAGKSSPVNSESLLPADNAVIEKQRQAIGLLLKQTVQNLLKDGLQSIDTPRAILNAKNILPGEFTQLYIQSRVEQHKLTETLAAQLLKPAPLSTATVKQWFPGQLIQSIVYQGTENGIASLLVSKNSRYNPDILLQLNNQKINNEIIRLSQSVQIKTQLPLQAGQQLLLQIEKTASELSFSLKHTPEESQRISHYINKFSVKQQALPQLLASLNTIITQSNQSSQFFSAAFREQVARVVQQFPTLEKLTHAENIRQAINYSGTYLESILRQSSANEKSSQAPQQLSSDLKTALNQLVTLIKNNAALVYPKTTTSEHSLYKNLTLDSLIKAQSHANRIFDLPAQVVHAQVQKAVVDASLFQLSSHLLMQNRILDQLEGVLSRIIVNQLQTREGGEQAYLNFEVPFRHGERQEVLQLKIRQQLAEKKAEQGHKIWTVNLAFELPSLGGIRIYITMDQRDLAIQFWTEEKASQVLFQQYFQLLNERLINAGFSVSQLAAFHGLPEAAEQELNSSTFIIDERV